MSGSQVHCQQDFRGLSSQLQHQEQQSARSERQGTPNSPNKTADATRLPPNGERTQYRKTNVHVNKLNNSESDYSYFFN